MKKKIIITAVLALVLTCGQALAAGRGGRAAPAPRSRPTTDAGPAQRANNANARTDARQGMQAQRIEAGIDKGYLTPSEVSKLDAQQKSIEAAQQAFMADGKVTRNEVQQLRQQLDEASLCIFAEKHDADGKTMPVYSFGKNVMLKNEIAQKLGDENLSRLAARAFLSDFHRMMEIKKILATATLDDAKRAQLQTEYNKLLNIYFVKK